MTLHEPSVSRVTGRRQAPVLRYVSTTAWALAALGTFGFVANGTWAATAAITMIGATPVLRVAWLMVRWSQEKDWRFVWIGAGLIAVIGLGAVLALR